MWITPSYHSSNMWKYPRMKSQNIFKFQIIGKYYPHVYLLPRRLGKYNLPPAGEAVKTQACPGPPA